MSRQNNHTNTERERKTDGQRRDAASHSLRYDEPRNEQRMSPERGRGAREVSMSRRYLNDLYERSSI